MGNLKFKNLKFKKIGSLFCVVAIIFVFNVSSNFVFAANTNANCVCGVSGSIATSTCPLNFTVSTTTCTVKSAGTNDTLSTVMNVSGSCTCIPRGTGGLVPCVNDCNAEDLFGNPLDYANAPPIWTSLIRTALGISGIFILLMFVYGGIMIIISRGDKDKIKKAQDIMKNSVIGLLIVIFAYTFVKFIVIALVDNKWQLFFGGQ